MLAPSHSTRRTIDRKPPRRRADSDLIEACLRGDRTAWDDLVEQYGRLVYSIARRYGMDDADADDVFQAVFLTVFERLETLRDHERFSAWLITTTHRQCWRSGRRPAAAGALDEHIDEHIADPSTPGDEQVDAWERQHLVRRGLEILGGRCELLLKTLFDAGAAPDYTTVARRLGMKVGSIGPTRARCFAKLERVLTDLGLNPDVAGFDDPENVVATDVGRATSATIPARAT